MPDEKPRRPSIRDVATAAGVSTSTVSRVLLNESKVSDRARAAVLKAIDETGYVPDMGARGLRSGRTRSIGISVADLRYSAFVDFIRSFGEVVGSPEYPLLITDAMWDAEVEGVRVKELLARRVDAVVAVYPRDVQHFVDAQRRGVPTLLVPRAFEQVPDSMPSVSIDDNEALRAIMAEVSAQGHRQVHYVTRFGRWAEARGHLNSVASEFGLEILNVDVDPELVRFVHSEPSLRDILPQSLLQPDGATCLFVAQHTVVPVLSQIRRAGLSVPEDISIVVNGHLDWASVVDPALDTFETDFALLGELAGHAVLDLLEGRKRPLQLGASTNYAKRGSVAAPRSVAAV